MSVSPPASPPVSPPPPASPPASPPVSPPASPPVSPPPPPGANAVRSFADDLPEDIRGEAVFKDIKDLAGLAKGYHHAQKLLGRDPSTIAVIPGPDDAEGWTALQSKLGRPDAADKYQLKPAAGTTYSDTDKAFQSQVLPLLHEAGLTQRQLDVLVPKWDALMAGAGQQSQAAKDAKVVEATAALKKEWGAAYDERVKLAEDAIGHFGDDDLRAYLVETGLNNDPRMIKALAKYGAGLKEDGLLGKDGGGFQGALAPVEAQQQIAGLQNDKEFMKSYMDKRAPGHADAVAKMQRFYDQAYPSA